MLVSRDTPIETVFMSYDKVFNNFPGQLKIGKATSVEANSGGRGGKIILDNEDEMPYDVVVVATGSSWEGLVDFPDDETLYKEFIEEWRTKFENANNVVIVGGGAVGIGETAYFGFRKKIAEIYVTETAGEIKDVYPVSTILGVWSGKNLTAVITGQGSHNHPGRQTSLE